MFFLVLYNSDLILGELFFDNLLPTFRDLHLYICMISLDTDGQWEPWLLYFRRRSWMSIVTNGLAWCRRWSCIDPRPRWQWWPVVWRLMTGLIGSMFTHCFIMLHYGLLMSWMFKISYSLMPTHTYIYNYRYTYVYINTYIIRYITFRSSLYLSCHRRSLLVGEQLGLCTWPHVLTLLPGAGGTSAVPMLGSTLGMVIIPPMKIVMHGGIVYVFLPRLYPTSYDIREIYNLYYLILIYVYIYIYTYITRVFFWRYQSHIYECYHMMFIDGHHITSNIYNYIYYIYTHVGN